MADKWKILFEHLASAGTGIQVRYQGTMSKDRFNALLEILSTTRDVMFSAEAKPRAKPGPKKANSEP